MCQKSGTVYRELRAGRKSHTHTHCLHVYKDDYLELDNLSGAHHTKLISLSQLTQIACPSLYWVRTCRIPPIHIGLSGGAVTRQVLCRQPYC